MTTTRPLPLVDRQQAIAGFADSLIEMANAYGIPIDTDDQACRDRIRTATRACIDALRPPGRPRHCYYIAPEQRDERGYIPSVVVEGEAGYSPMVGDGSEFAIPWYWGTTYEQAQATCAEVNADLGLTPEDVHEIILSSMTATD